MLSIFLVYNYIINSKPFDTFHLAHCHVLGQIHSSFLMMSALVGNKSIFGIHCFVANFTLICHIEVFAMSTLNMVLHSVQFVAHFPTNQTRVSRPAILFDKFLQFCIPL